MPSTPTSFASAAAGQSRGSRPGDDWSRRDGRSVNGTMTFRRTATSATNPQSTPGSDTAAPATAPTESHTAQPSLPPFDGSLRYTRENLIDIYNGISLSAVNDLYVNGWNPTQAQSAQRGWGKSSEGTIPQDPTVCWEPSGSVRPVGTHEMTEQEKEMFLDVNSTLKPQQPKEANPQGAVNTAIPAGVPNGRKSSVSHGAGYNNTSTNASGSGINTGNNTANTIASLSAISSSRPTARRRETSDTASAFPGGGLASPIGNRTPRDESSWFGRKNTESKESQPLNQLFAEPEEEPNSAAPRPANLSTLPRNNTIGGGIGGTGASTLWGGSGQASGPPSAGAFGSFALPTPTTEKRFGSVRGESRLAHLLPKQDGTEGLTGGKPAAPVGSSAAPAAPAAPVAPTATAAASAGTLGNPSTKDSWKPRQRTDTDPFGITDPSQQPATQSSGALDTPVKTSRGDFGMYGLNIGSALDEDTLGSPDTNPFRSPPERATATTLESDQHPHAALQSIGAIGGNGGHDHATPFSSLRGTGYPGGTFDHPDRSQTSSAGTKGFPGLGNIAGWGNPMNVTTPDRERAPFSNAFGAALFSPSASELPSAGFVGGPGGGVFGPSGAGPTGSMRSTTSKLNALFPPSMQAQMSNGQDSDASGLGDSIPDLRQINPLGAIGRETIGSQVRDSEPRSTRALFDDPLNQAHAGGFAEQSSQPGMTPSAAALVSTFDGPPNIGADSSQNQQRMMVMPDRMRWVYLDPQAVVQGPFTGLEMNDWYKANFFTPDLRVKKVEDTEFEPLGQLIRRIGNSREPFLVPQMGVPHGLPSLSGTFVHGNHGGVVPPLVNAFPSYGRTLTAEEQNNLERRKQEEQYLIARQREMQVTGQHLPPFTPGRLGAVGVPTGALHHHSSAHSLQSQPSFGSMTAPAPPHIPGQVGGQSAFFDHAGMPQSTQPHLQSSSEFLRDEYGIDDRSMLPNSVQQAIHSAVGNFPASIQPHAQPQAPGQAGPHNPDPNSLSKLPTVDQLQPDAEGFNERLREFNSLREQLDLSEFLGANPSEAPQSLHRQHTQVTMAADELNATQSQIQSDAHNSIAGADAPTSPLAAMSLAHRAQAQAAIVSQQRQETEEARPNVGQPAVQSDMPMPFPPPQTEATIAAPTAQRKSTLPDQFNTTSSRPETPDSSSSAAQPPPLAPWALQPGSESHRGPSLREIQAAEAEKAAKDEELAAATRRSAAEHEAALQRERERAAAAIAPGLPTSSTWGNGTPTSASATPTSPWAKASANKASASVAVAASATHGASDKKKTLAEIQREEEASKQKTRDLSSQSPSNVPHVGKRYADLASRVQPPVATAIPVAPVIAPPAAAGWATVGAGGKIKTPAGPAAIRSPIAPPPIKTPLSSVARSVSRQLPGRADGGAAMEEFNKWLHREVSRGVSVGIDVNDFVDILRQLPAEIDIISEAVYGSSTTMDGRHFAEEFIRRKKAAEKGITDSFASSSSTSNSGSTGGWSEVAKKSTGTSAAQKEEAMPAGFKVVPSRKKGRK